MPLPVFGTPPDLSNRRCETFRCHKIYNRADYRFDPKGIGYSYRGYSLFLGQQNRHRVDSGVPDFNYYGIARHSDRTLPQG